VSAAPVLPARRSPVRRAAALLVAVLSLLGVLAGPAAAATSDLRRYAVTTAQERVVLELIDDICGDTWCEGEHAFRFSRFDCHPRRGCVLRAQIASWTYDPLRWQERSARLLGFPRFRDMVVAGPDGSWSLQPAFFEAVGEAVGEMTATVS